MTFAGSFKYTDKRKKRKKKKKMERKKVKVVEIRTAESAHGGAFLAHHLLVEGVVAPARGPTGVAVAFLVQVRARHCAAHV